MVVVLVVEAWLTIAAGRLRLGATAAFVAGLVLLGAFTYGQQMYRGVRPSGFVAAADCSRWPATARDQRRHCMFILTRRSGDQGSLTRGTVDAVQANVPWPVPKPRLREQPGVRGLGVDAGLVLLTQPARRVHRQHHTPKSDPADAVRPGADAPIPSRRTSEVLARAAQLAIDGITLTAGAGNGRVRSSTGAGISVAGNADLMTANVAQSNSLGVADFGTGNRWVSNTCTTGNGGRQSQQHRNAEPLGCPCE